MSLLLLLTGAGTGGVIPPPPPPPEEEGFPGRYERVVEVRIPDAFIALNVVSPPPQIAVALRAVGPFAVHAEVTAAPATLAMRAHVTSLQLIERRAIEDGQLLSREVDDPL